MRSRAGRRVLPLVAAASSVAWIAIILPALSPSSFRPEHLIPRVLGPLPAWRDAFLGLGSRLGSAVAAMASMTWAWWVGALDPEHGLWKPWKVESWILDVFGFGGVFGAIAAAALPPWIIWWVSRVVVRRPLGARAPRLSLNRALRATVEAGRGSASGWALLAGLALIGSHAGAGVEWSLGRHGDVPSLAGFLASGVLGAVVGLASVRLGLALIDARPLDAAELLGDAGRIATYTVTAGALSALALVGSFLGILPGVACAVTFGFAPFVAAEDSVLPLQAFARSAALTRGARWPLLRIGVTLGGLSVALVYLLTRGAAAGVPPAATMLIYDVVLAPFSVLLACHLYRQLIASLPKTRSDESADRGWRRDPALAVAAAWSVALMVPFGWGVLERVRHPNPAWLMLPPLRGDRADTRVPLSAWCPYSQHASASGCEWALASSRNLDGIDGYAFKGARCVPATAVEQPSVRERIVAHLETTLGEMLGDGAVVRRSERIGSDVLDLVVVAEDEDGGPPALLGIDVDDREAQELDRDRLARLAAAGLPEYWHVSEPRGPFPAMVTIWSEPLPDERTYASQRGWGGSGGDAELKPITLGDARLSVSDLVPPVCPPPPDTALATPPDCDHALAFVVDGTSPEPSFQLTRGFGSARPTGFRFAAVSSAPARFDPWNEGLTVEVHAADPPSDLIQAVLPPGPGWTQEASGSAWTYRDGSGASGGITDVKIARVGPEAKRLAWGIEARLEPDAVSPAALPQWTTVAVTLTLDPSSQKPGACGEVFFAVGSGAGRCPLDVADEAVRCSVSSPGPACDAADLDAMVRCAVEESARAEDAYFARHGAYFSGVCSDLPGVPAREGVTCTTTASPTSFSVTALHAGMKHGCTLESAKRQEGVGCS